MRKLRLPFPSDGGHQWVRKTSWRNEEPKYNAAAPKDSYQHPPRGGWGTTRYYCTVCKITVFDEGPKPEDAQCIDVVARYVHES